MPEAGSKARKKTATRKAKASYKDGLLELRLPKVRKSKKHAVKVE